MNYCASRNESKIMNNISKQYTGVGTEVSQMKIYSEKAHHTLLTFSAT